MKIAIIGSRDFNDYELLLKTVFNNDKILIQKHMIKYLVSGGALGADSLAQRFAKDHGLPIIIYYPDWDKYGKSAGFIRNEKIIKTANLVIAFHKNKSRGTSHSIKLAKELNKDLIIKEV